MEYVSSLKYIAGIEILNNKNIKYNANTLILDCMEFLKSIKNIKFTGEIAKDIIKFTAVNDLEMIKYLYEKNKTKSPTKIFKINTTKYYYIENHVFNEYEVVLLYSAAHGFLDIIEFTFEIINNEINFISDFENIIDQLLRLSSANRRINIVKYLFNKFECNTSHYKTAFEYAAINSCIDIMKYTYENKLIELNKDNNDYISNALMYASKRKCQSDVIKYIYHINSNLSSLPSYICVIRFAAMYNNIDIIKLLLEKYNDDSNAYNETLFYAEQFKSYNVLMYMLKNKKGSLQSSKFKKRKNFKKYCK